MRHSGFFLFQSPYAEYFFSELNWPDFDASELDHALEDFSKRKRKFGK
jgi:undecaprenyl diphosphate synthase